MIRSRDEHVEALQLGTTRWDDGVPHPGGGQASAPRVPTATAPAMGSAAFGAGAGKSEEPLDLGTMPVTLIADLAGLSARR
jgi:hypothetical protein